VTAKASGIVSGALVVAATTSLAVGAGQAVREIVFVGARLVDVEAGRLVDDATIVVRDGRVETIGPAGTVSLPDGARAVDLRGRFVLPGLVSAHVHVSDVHGDRPRAHTDGNTARQLGVFARYGITTVLSLDGEGDPGFKARGGQATPALDRARLFLSGDAVAASTPDEARRLVAAVAARRPDFVKIRVDDNLGTDRRRCRPTCTGPSSTKRTAAACAWQRTSSTSRMRRTSCGRVSTSSRTACAIKDIDEEFIALMKARDVPYCPTLTRELSTFVYESTPRSSPIRSSCARPIRAVVARLQEPARQQRHGGVEERAGLQGRPRRGAPEPEARGRRRDCAWSMGTDAGPLPERFQGYFEHLEMEMMVEAGLTPAQVLRAAATIDGASGPFGSTRSGGSHPAPGPTSSCSSATRSTTSATRGAIASVYVAGNEVSSIARRPRP
jgi:hypothetical protein